VDSIKLHGVRAWGRHGADPGERERRQLFEIDLTLWMDLQGAASSDDLTQTVDYAAVRDRLIRVVSQTSYALLERLAADLLEEVFLDARVLRADVTVSKPHLLAGATASVTLERANPRNAAAE
jgi:dihydroneopterin aldolase